MAPVRSFQAGHALRGFTESAFVDLYRQCSPLVWRYAAKRIGNDLADDVTSQTFADLWRTRERFDPDLGTLEGWMWGIAVNVLRRHQTRELRQLEILVRNGELGSSSLEVIDIHHRVDVRSSWPAVAAALLGMSDTDREAITLALWAELSYAEIAQALGVEVGTVKSRVSRARARLRDQLEREGVHIG